MKKLLVPVLFLFPFILLYSCKKDSASNSDNNNNSDSPRLVKLQMSSSSNSYTPVVFNYDQSGRIVSIADSAKPTQPFITISYTTDAATITQIATTSVNYQLYKSSYKLNSNNQPVQRIRYDSSNALASSYPQLEVSKDTCKYEYDAAGLLLKATGTHYDSSWYNFNVVEITVERKAYTRNYTNNAGMLMSSKSTSTGFVNYTRGAAATIKTNKNIEENYSFQYTNHNSNKTDFVNAWIFAELGLLYTVDYPLIKTYAYYPDKISYSTTSTNADNGQFLSTSTANYTNTLEYTSSGYIAAYTQTEGSGSYWDKFKFIYDK